MYLALNQARKIRFMMIGIIPSAHILASLHPFRTWQWTFYIKCRILQEYGCRLCSL